MIYSVKRIIIIKQAAAISLGCVVFEISRTILKKKVSDKPCNKLNDVIELVL